MNYEEFREGNYFYRNNELKTIGKNLGLNLSKAIKWENDKIQNSEIIRVLKEENLSPIKLTNQLLKRNCKKNDHLDFIFDKMILRVNDDNNNVDVLHNVKNRSEYDLREIELKIEYLHQLQNMYYDINGKELELDETNLK